MNLGMLLTLAGMVECVWGHAAVLMPPARNSVDTEPGTPWSGGKHPSTGWIMPYGGFNCSNGTSMCASGQAAFLFSQGCTIGCEACTGNGARIPNFDHCLDSPKPIDEFMLNPKYRTTNFGAVQNSLEDIWKFNPWRAPGKAPVYDPCGMAGGSPHGTFNAGEYNTTIYAKQGDVGSQLKPRPSGTVWKRGSTATTRWYQAANHGGGYQFRLCKASEPLTEACFQRTPLAFATEKQMVRFSDPSQDFAIDAMIVKEGGGKGWMRWPFPNYHGGQCDYVVQPPNHCTIGCPGCSAPLFAADNSCPCDCNTQYPGLPAGNATPQAFPSQIKGDYAGYVTNLVIEDTVVVPSDIEPGEYVLGWRWDCEMTSQIWQSCSDITIV